MVTARPHLMQIALVSLAVTLIAAQTIGTRAAATTPDEQDATSKYGDRTPVFVENRGQSHPMVRFQSAGGGVPIFFTGRDVRMVLTRGEVSTALAIELVGAAPSAIEPGRVAGGRVNYITADLAHTALPAHREVIYRDAWPGIDVVFRSGRLGLAYDFVVRPGGRVSDIRLRIDGAHSIAITPAADLQITTAVGLLTDQAPQTYQPEGAERRALPSKYVITGPNEFSFDVAEYDATLPLVIDPQIVYATYLGGAGLEEARGVAVDNVGSAYIAGFTGSPNFPVTTGAFPRRSGIDAFVVKLTPSGRAFEYATYLGGSFDDSAHGIAVDASGNAFVTGYTRSADFPVTRTAYKTAKGVSEDGFVTKLNAQGTAVVYSTFLGANALTFPAGIALDLNGNAYIAGHTLATDLPLTPGRIATARAGGGFDGFLLKFNPAGSSVLYGSYLAGGASDNAARVAVDDAQHAYVVGTTWSTDFPTTAGAPQRSLRGPADAFVMKIQTQATSPGAALVYSTYIGGSRHDTGKAIAVHRPSQSAFVGIENGSYEDFPTTDGGSALNGIVVKLNATGTEFMYARGVGPTYLGYTVLEALAVDTNQVAYVAGSTDDQNNRTWVSRVDEHGRESSRIELNGKVGPSTDWPFDIAADDNDNVYVAGKTQSPDFPVTANAAQPSFGGSSGASDGYVAKISFADVGKTNIALGRTAIASSIESASYPASNAVDGDLETRWSSRFSDPQWISIDLGQRYQIDRVVLHWETAFGRDYELQVSDDAVNWYPVRSTLTGFHLSLDEPGEIDNRFNLIGAGRYLRIYGISRGTQWGYSLWEFEIYGMPALTPAPPPGGANLSQNYGFAWASSYEDSSYLATHVIDGNARTRWSSLFSDPQWIVVDLGIRADITRVVLRWETAYGRDYTIDVSDDANSWRTVRTVVGGDGGVDDHSQISGTGRYVRMHGTRRGTPWGYSLWEFEVYGKIASAGPADLVLYAADVRHLGLQLVSDPTAAGGSKLVSPERGFASPDQVPSFEAGFADFFPVVQQTAQYHVWLRLKAQGNTKFSDSVWVQFSQAFINGQPAYEIGSSEALLVNLENCSNCGVSSWGWQDNSWWLNQPATVSLRAGLNMIRVIVREDGVEFDQIVLSPVRYLSTPPGPVKNDTTIVPK